MTTDTGKMSATSIPLADLSVFQIADPLPPRLGQDFNYRIRVANNGPDTATGVVLTDILAVTATGDGIMENRISALGAEADPYLDDNAAARRDAVATDRDGDGIPDSVELAGCTDADLADTDGDGLADGLEDNNFNGVP